MKSKFIHSNAPIWQVAFRRDRCNRIGRALAFELLVVARIRKEIDFLRLPRLEPFQQGFVHMAWFCNLRGKSGWITGQIEGLGGDDARSLVVTVILADENSGKPGQYDVRPSDPNHANNVFQSLAVMPVGERLQHILAWSVAAAQKPDILHSHGTERVAQFHFSSNA